MLVARWETRGKKYWYELSRDNLGFTYRGKGCGGNLGNISKGEAIQHLERYMEDSRIVDGHNYKLVKMEA